MKVYDRRMKCIEVAALVVGSVPKGMPVSLESSHLQIVLSYAKQLSDFVEGLDKDE